MPVNAIPLATEMVINLDNGVSATGNTLIRARRYSGLKTDAMNDDIYLVASQMAALQQKEVVSIQRRDITELAQ